MASCGTASLWRQDTFANIQETLHADCTFLRVFKGVPINCILIPTSELPLIHCFSVCPVCVCSDLRLLPSSSGSRCCGACRWAISQPRESSDTAVGRRVRQRALAIPTIRKSHTQDRNNNCTSSTTVPPCTQMQKNDRR